VVSAVRSHAAPELSRSKSATGAGRTERPELTKLLGLITPGDTRGAVDRLGWHDSQSDHAVA
jgi:hypothetical protein